MGVSFKGWFLWGPFSKCRVCTSKEAAPELRHSQRGLANSDLSIETADSLLVWYWADQPKQEVKRTQSCPSLRQSETLDPGWPPNYIGWLQEAERVGQSLKGWQFEPQSIAVPARCPRAKLLTSNMSEWTTVSALAVSISGRKMQYQQRGRRKFEHYKEKTWNMTDCRNVLSFSRVSKRSYENSRRPVDVSPPSGFS